MVEWKKKIIMKTYVEEQPGVVKIAHILHPAPGTLVGGACRDRGAETALARALRSSAAGFCGSPPALTL